VNIGHKEVLTDLQVEYLVVTYKDKDPQVTLSLRQADILTALAQDEELCTEGGCVPDLQDVDRYSCISPCVKHFLTSIGQALCRSFILNLADSCWRLRLENHGALASRIYWMWSQT